MLNCSNISLIYSLSPYSGEEMPEGKFCIAGKA